MKHLLLILLLCSTSTLLNGQSAAGNALHFDGINDYAVLQPVASGLPAGTIEMWFLADAWNSSTVLWCGGASIPGSNYDWVRIGSHFSSGSNSLNGGFFGPPWHWVVADSVPDLDVWYHVAFTWGDGEGMKMYLNGEVAGVSGDRSAPAYSTGLIGTSSWGDYFNGAIDEVRVWNRPRSQQQLQATMLDTLAPVHYSTADSGLIAYFRMDALEDLGIAGGGADDIRDLSVLANHADTRGDPQVGPSGGLVGLENMAAGAIAGFELGQNYPNPFNPETSIPFSIPTAADVRLTVYDLLGRSIARLVDGRIPAGSHLIRFDGNGLPSGMYWYRLEFPGAVSSKQMFLVK